MLVVVIVAVVGGTKTEGRVSGFYCISIPDTERILPSNSSIWRK